LLFNEKLFEQKMRKFHSDQISGVYICPRTEPQRKGGKINNGENKLEMDKTTNKN